MEIPKCNKIPSHNCFNATWKIKEKFEIQSMKVAELKALCVECGIHKNGQKSKIQVRIWAHALSCHSDVYMEGVNPDDEAYLFHQNKHESILPS